MLSNTMKKLLSMKLGWGESRTITFSLFRQYGKWLQKGEKAKRRFFLSTTLTDALNRKIGTRKGTKKAQIEKISLGKCSHIYPNKEIGRERHKRCPKLGNRNGKGHHVFSKSEKASERPPSIPKIGK